MAYRQWPLTVLAVVLLIAFGLQLVAVLSVPVTKAITLCTFGDIQFGVFGYCNTKTNTCSDVQIGYGDVTSIEGFSLPSNARHTLASLLIVHVVACGLTLILLILTLLAHLPKLFSSSKFLLAILIITLPCFLLSLLAFLVDILLFVPHLDWGGWIVLASTVLIAVFGVFLCVLTRTTSSRRAMGKRIHENSELQSIGQYDSAFSGGVSYKPTANSGDFIFSNSLDKNNINPPLPEFNEVKYETNISTHTANTNEDQIPLTGGTRMNNNNHGGGDIIGDTSFASSNGDNTRNLTPSPLRQHRTGGYRPPTDQAFIAAAATNAPNNSRYRNITPSEYSQSEYSSYSEYRPTTNNTNNNNNNNQTNYSQYTPNDSRIPQNQQVPPRQQYARYQQQPSIPQGLESPLNIPPAGTFEEPISNTNNNTRNIGGHQQHPSGIIPAGTYDSETSYRGPLNNNNNQYGGVSSIPPRLQQQQQPTRYNNNNNNNNLVPPSNSLQNRPPINRNIDSNESFNDSVSKKQPQRGYAASPSAYSAETGYYSSSDASQESTNNATTTAVVNKPVSNNNELRAHYLDTTNNDNNLNDYIATSTVPTVHHNHPLPPQHNFNNNNNNNNNLPPLNNDHLIVQNKHSNTSFTTSSSSPAISETSHFTSISQREPNPKSFIPSSNNNSSGNIQQQQQYYEPVPRRNLLAQERQNLLLQSNPDFQISINKPKYGQQQQKKIQGGTGAAAKKFPNASSISGINDGPYNIK